MSNARDFAARVPVDGALGSRNKIINGDFRVMQRGNNLSVADNFGADRWRSTYVDDGVAHRSHTVTSAQDYSWGGTTSNICRFASTDNTANRFSLYYRVEAKDLSGTDGNTLTLSFKIARTGTITGSPVVKVIVWGANGVDNYSTTTLRQDTSIGALTALVPSDKTFETLSVQIPMTDPMGVNGIELEISVQRDDGQPFTSSDTVLAFTEVQLEVGDTATPFEHRSYGDELARCQRFFYSSATGDFRYGHQAGDTDTYRNWTFMHPVYMRSSPTITQTSNGSWGSTATGVEAGIQAIHFFHNFGNTNGPYWIGAYTADAEL